MLLLILKTLTVLTLSAHATTPPPTSDACEAGLEGTLRIAEKVAEAYAEVNRQLRDYNREYTPLLTTGAVLLDLSPTEVLDTYHRVQKAEPESYSNSAALTMTVLKYKKPIEEVVANHDWIWENAGLPSLDVAPVLVSLMYKYDLSRERIVAEYTQLMKFASSSLGAEQEDGVGLLSIALESGEAIESILGVYKIFAEHRGVHRSHRISLTQAAIRYSEKPEDQAEIYSRIRKESMEGKSSLLGLYLLSLNLGVPMGETEVVYKALSANRKVFDSRHAFPLTATTLALVHQKEPAQVDDGSRKYGSDYFNASEALFGHVIDGGLIDSGLNSIAGALGFWR